MTVGWPFCTVAQTELVVPRSMPMTSSPTSCLQRPEERLGLLVVGGLAEKQGQFVARARLLAGGDQRPHQQHPRDRVVRLQLRRAPGPEQDGAHVAALHRTARGAARRGEAGRIVLIASGVGGEGIGEAPVVLLLLRGHHRRAGAGACLLALELHQLGTDLLAVRIELARGLERRDRVGALAVERVLQRLLVQLAGGADAGESLGAKQALAPLARAALLLGARELAPLHRLAVGVRELGAMVAIVRGAQLLVGERLVAGGEPLEPLGEERRERAQVLAVIGVGVEALRLLEVRAADGPAVGVGGDSEQLVERQAAAARLELANLALHVLRKVDVPCAVRRRSHVPPGRRRAQRPAVPPEYLTASFGEKDPLTPSPPPR